MFGVGSPGFEFQALHIHNNLPAGFGPARWVPEVYRMNITTMADIQLPIHPSIRFQDEAEIYRPCL